MTFNIELLTARYGDSIWIEYGQAGVLSRILIDGGTRGTSQEIRSKIEGVPEDERFLELLVVTHIDQDHLQGIQALLESEHLSVNINDFWFNGWDNLPKPNIEGFGAKQAENMSRNILRHRIPWNKSFDGKAVVIGDTGGLPVVVLPGGMKLTLLAPTVQALTELRRVWEEEIQKAGLVPGFGTAVQPELDENIEAFGAEEPNVEELNGELFEEDQSEANASSIAFLAEFGGKSVLFLGDALPSQICASLRRIQPVGKFVADLVKVSHHASLGNTSPELIEMLDCKRFAISTNGSIYGHPKQQTVAKLIKRAGPEIELNFNYRSKYNKVWDSSNLRAVYRYNTIYLGPGEKIDIANR